MSVASRTKVPLGLRLKAWWDGNQVKVNPRAAESFDEMGAADGGGLGSEPWSDARIALAQDVWGEGRVAPGDDAYLCELVAPLALTEHMEMLDIGAGLGGASRVVAAHFKCRVRGFEPDPRLGAAGALLTEESKLAGRARILSWDDPGFPPEPESVDCIFSKDFFYLVENKPSLLAKLANALKRPGQLLFTDFVLASEDGPRGDVEAWTEVDPERPQLWTAARYEKLFADLGLEHRISLDVSDRVKQTVVKGWAQFLRSDKRGGPGDHRAPAMVREVELWTRRMAALQSGQLRVYRFFVLKRDEGQKLSAG